MMSAVQCYIYLKMRYSSTSSKIVDIFYGLAWLQQKNKLAQGTGCKSLILRNACAAIPSFLKNVSRLRYACLPFTHLQLSSSDSSSTLIFFLLLSSLSLPTSAFPSVHIVGSVSSKLASTNHIQLSVRHVTSC